LFLHKVKMQFIVTSPKINVLDDESSRSPEPLEVKLKVTKHLLNRH